MKKMDIGFYGHVRQYHNLRDEINTVIQDVLEGGKYVMGPVLENFEKELANYWGVKHAVGVNSGTDALWLALIALGIGTGNEVITTANTFFATAEAIWIAGAKPVFVDSNRKTHNIDVAKIEEKITSDTRAIIPVHLYGQPAEMKEIHNIAKKYKLKVIEDAAQAFGARGDTFRLGELSDAVCTSFIAQKNLGTYGDGGAVLSNNGDVINRINALRNHGSIKRSVHSMGYNSRLDDLHAGVLGVKLRYIDAWNRRRIEIARQYDRALQETGLVLPFCKAGYYHVYHLYVVHTPQRDSLQKFLLNEGITALTHYPIAIHHQEGYPWGRPADKKTILPNTEWNAAECLSLPMYPEMADEEIAYVIENIRKWSDK